MEKKELRKLIRLEKLKYSDDDRCKMSLPICSDLESNSIFINAKNVMLYWSMSDEVDTHALVNKWAKIKNVFLPCVKGDDMEIRKFTGMVDMKEGERYGILEPIGELLLDYSVLDLVVVPGVAFDSACNRMGRGKGYYDKFLKEVSAYKLGICFGFQMVDSVPHDALDVKMDEVIFR